MKASHTAILARCSGGWARGLDRTRPPLVLADGFCPGCGRLVPIAEYLDLLRPFRGRLVLDDTQALGIYGDSPGAAAPLRPGRRRIAARAGISDSADLLVSSLAKGFGAPLAMLAGSAANVARLEAEARRASTAARRPSQTCMPRSGRSVSTLRTATIAAHGWSP